MTIRCARVLFAASIAGLLAMAASADEPRSKSTQTEADWVAYDPDTSTITVVVRKPGRGADARKLKKNRETTFAVKSGGTILTSTVVTINGQKVDIADLPAGKRVNVYWRPQEDGTLFARKIDAIMSEEEFDAKYGTGD